VSEFEAAYRPRYEELRVVVSNRWILTTAFAVLAVLASGGASWATAPGANGSIVYTLQVGIDEQLFTVEPNGSRPTQLTDTDGGVYDPDWAPDGSSIVAALETTVWGIHLLDASGQNPRPVPGTEAGEGEYNTSDPSFSPDGSSIVFVRDDNIWAVGVDGSRPRQVTRCGCDVEPNFSPDGRWITFVRLNPAVASAERERTRALFIVRPDGRGLRQLTSYSRHLARKHDWSPDGRRLLVTVGADTGRDDVSANLVTMRPDGSGSRRVTRFTGGARHAFAGSYSPDGKQIAFRLDSGRQGVGAGRRFSVAVVDVDGRNLRVLATSRALPNSIDWGPSGA
jgi:Tol biopolymer transport system component